MPHSDQYLHLKKKHKKPLLFQKKMTLLDKMVLFVSVAYPLSALPQAVQVFQGNVEGVSIISWMSFLVCASLFFVYGLKNKVFPMIISNILWIAMDSLVVIGLLSARYL